MVTTRFISTVFILVERIKGSPHQYGCNACCRVYEMSNMEQQALTSHMTKSKKHEQIMDARNVKAWYVSLVVVKEMV